MIRKRLAPLGGTLVALSNVHITLRLQVMRKLLNMIEISLGWL
jgi:hypothetical protein